MAKTIRVEVITSEGLAASDEAVAVRAPGGMGSFGMLHNHAPLVSTIEAGTFLWRRADGRVRSALIGPGLLEIARNRCTLLTDAYKETVASEHPEGIIA